MNMFVFMLFFYLSGGKAATVPDSSISKHGCKAATIETTCHGHFGLLGWLL
jgi:hypothetical protein